MRLQHVEAQYLARPVREQFANGNEIAERLRHLVALDLQKTVVHPDVRHARGMEGASGLRKLVLVVRKHEIDTAAMDVEGFAEMLPGHRRAFDVPARPPLDLDAGRRR